MTFADNYLLRTPNAANFIGVANALDAQLVRASVVSDSTLRSISSSTMTLYTGATFTLTLAAGEMVLLSAQLSISHNTLAGLGAFCWYQSPSTGLQFELGVTLPVADGGPSARYYTVATEALQFANNAGGAGTYTFELRWNTASGIFYGKNLLAKALVFRNT